MTNGIRWGLIHDKKTKRQPAANAAGCLFYPEMGHEKKGTCEKKRENTYLPIFLICIPCYNAPSFQKER
ncbi:MAG: hypothetical protein MR374_09125, partial [Clostridia bacterium]|nr:hypothetical protein [Clostridia bacterium]